MEPNRRREITCITCPSGCRITAAEAGGELVFTGNKCPKGAQFALAEMTFPVRSLTTTVRTAFPEMPVLPVRTRGEVPREKMADIMRELSKIVITGKIGIGETVVSNISGTGCDIIATSNMLCTK